MILSNVLIIGLRGLGVEIGMESWQFVVYKVL
jgi:hypothetical protein